MNEQSHRDASRLYTKSFPLFDDLEHIFAKDRAFGINVATIANRVELDMSHDSILEAVQYAHMIHEDGENDEDVNDVSAQEFDTRGKKKRSSATVGSSKKSRANKKLESVHSITGETMK